MNRCWDVRTTVRTDERTPWTPSTERSVRQEATRVQPELRFERIVTVPSSATYREEKKRPRIRTQVENFELDCKNLLSFKQSSFKDGISLWRNRRNAPSYRNDPPLSQDMHSCARSTKVLLVQMCSCVSELNLSLSSMSDTYFSGAQTVGYSQHLLFEI